MSVWTVKSLLDWTVNYLKKYSIEQPRHEAEYLLSELLGKNRTGVYLNFERPVTEEELTRFKTWLMRRKNKEPLQYILGKTHFMGLEFAVGQGCFIPRFATETLVEHIIEYVKRTQKASLKMYEIGGGSGAIAVSCAYFLPQLRIECIEKNSIARNYIHINSDLHNVTDRIMCHDGDFWDRTALPDCDIIVSNPPYIALRDSETLDEEVKNFEPHDALFAGEDGLDFYRTFALRHASHIGKDTVIFFEIGYNQASDITAIFESYNCNSTVHKDIEGHDRVLVIRRRNE